MAAAASNRQRKLAKAFLDHWNACLAGIEAEHLSCARRMHPVAAGISSVSRSQVIAFLERATILAVTDAA
jgi:hypothetical protein